MCFDCVRALEQHMLPKFALANNLWIGNVPPELMGLTIPEQLLIARHYPHKGAPAWKSRTGTWLVSPATGCQKKKKNTSEAGPQNTKLSTLEILLASTDAMETGTAPGKPLQ